MEMRLKSENPFFHEYFFNMDISLIVTLTCLKTCMHIGEIFLEGDMSRSLDIGLSFCVIVCRIREFEKNKDIKRGIHVERIKVETLDINLLLS